MTNSIRIGKKSNLDRIFFLWRRGTLIPHRGFTSFFSSKKNQNKTKQNKAENWGHKVLWRLCSHDLNDQQYPYAGSRSHAKRYLHPGRNFRMKSASNKAGISQDCSRRSGIMGTAQRKVRGRNISCYSPLFQIVNSLPRRRS